MNNEKKLTKKYLILPMVLIGGIVATSVFTTATGAMLQSIKGNISALSLESERAQEKIHARTSLTFLNEEIQNMGFAKANTRYLFGSNTPLALR